MGLGPSFLAGHREVGISTYYSPATSKEKSDNENASLLTLLLCQSISISHGASAEQRFLGVFMTRNNLKDQLTWLLANAAFNAPNAPVLPQPQDQPTSRTTPSINQSTNRNIETRPDTPDPPLYPILPEPQNPISPQAELAANGSTGSVARPLEASARDAVGDKMGRPSKSSSRRPNLVLRQEQLLSPTSTSGAGSLSNEYRSLLNKPGQTPRPLWTKQYN